MTAIKTKSKGGRPRQDQAGEAERRLLDAALQRFLACGFEGTSCEDIARAAGASKATLYARYANKEALFEAVVQRHVATLLMPAETIPAPSKAACGTWATASSNMRCKPIPWP